MMPADLPPDLNGKVAAFLKERDVTTLYCSYEWEEDSYRQGFPRILRLEQQLRQTTRQNYLTREAILAVAEWGHLPNMKAIKLQTEPVRLDLYDERGRLLPSILSSPKGPLIQLQGQISGLGPTHLSKLLRFALPQEYGAIDSRLVRVFGEGDPASKQYDWLSLKVRRYGGRWHIPEAQSAWPDGYAEWIRVLRFLRDRLNEVSQPTMCPHPICFLRTGVRVPNRWECADVEMALFAYATSRTKKTNG